MFHTRFRLLYEMHSETFLQQLRKVQVFNILSTANSQHTQKETACCFHSFFWMQDLHVHTMAGAHKFSKSLEAISKT